MESVAWVTSVRAGRAHLACETSSACHSCGSGRGCALLWLGGRARSTLEVPDRTADDQPLRAGEPVRLRMPEGELVRCLALACVPPLAGLLAAPVLARSLLGAGEGGLLLAAAVGVAAGAWLARTALTRRPPRVLVLHSSGVGGGA